MLRWRVKEVLEQRKLSELQLSYRSGVSYNTIHKLCRNPTCHTRLTTLEKLADALDVPCETLMETVLGDK